MARPKKNQQAPQELDKDLTHEIKIIGKFCDCIESGTPIVGAKLQLLESIDQEWKPLAEKLTDDKGCAIFTVELEIGDSAKLKLHGEAFKLSKEVEFEILKKNKEYERHITVPLRLQLSLSSLIKKDDKDDKLTPFDQVTQGEKFLARCEYDPEAQFSGLNFGGDLPFVPTQEEKLTEVYFIADTPGWHKITSTIFDGGARATVAKDMYVFPATVQPITGNVRVTMQRPAAVQTNDLPLWVVIRKSAEALSFNNYMVFMNQVLCGESLPDDIDDYENMKIAEKKTEFNRLRQSRFLPYNDVDAYRLLKIATEAFVMVNCAVLLDTFPFNANDANDLRGRTGVNIDLATLTQLWRDYLKTVNGTSTTTLPYLALIRQKLGESQLKDVIFPIEKGFMDGEQGCVGILREKLTNPCLLELIWSYWHEEGMLVQTMNALSLRFQNIRSGSGRDPLANLEIDPLRPLNNLLWGYVQDEQHRLSIRRRAYEYDHHYGMTLTGKAVGGLQPASSRYKFLEAFHNLLQLCKIYFEHDDDTTVIADAFPVMHALKDVHFLLSEGAHNQFGDLPSTARMEMMMQQWLLARPEFREFLPTRIMVSYPETGWMDRVDAMKKLQGWSDSSILHFRNLGVFGEQILLSIRYGHWSDVSDATQAANWARFWRPEIQGYIQAYRTVTGMDLGVEITDAREAAQRYLPPAVHLQKRLAMQQKQKQLR